MAVPTKMTTHMLDGLKGWPRPHAVDFSAKLSANVTIDPLPSGRVVHLNSVGEYETGAESGEMPLFTFPNSNDPDVQNDGGDPAEDNDLPWVATAPTGEIMALVAIGAYELWTTEYDPEGEYAPNTPLKALHDNTGGTLGGAVEVGIIGTDHIVGIVSRGLISRWNKQVLAFWPVFCPAF